MGSSSAQSGTPKGPLPRLRRALYLGGGVRSSETHPSLRSSLLAAVLTLAAVAAALVAGSCAPGEPVPEGPELVPGVPGTPQVPGQPSEAPGSDPPPPLIRVEESITVAEAGQTGAPREISSVETIGVTEDVSVVPPVIIRVEEEFVAGDVLPLGVPPGLLHGEAIRVTEDVSVVPPVIIRVEEDIVVAEVQRGEARRGVSHDEGIHVTEEVSVVPPAMVMVAEEIAITERVPLRAQHGVFHAEALSVTEEVVFLPYEGSPGEGDVVLPPAATSLTPDDPSLSAEFGTSVAATDDGNFLLIGAPGSGADIAGASYVFAHDGQIWDQLARLKASDGALFDRLGFSVDVSGDGDAIVVGAPFDDDGGDTAGAAYIYRRPEAGWADAAEDAKLTAGAFAAADDEFGRAVAIDGDTVVAGAPFENGVGADSGAAYVLVRQAGAWSLQARLTAADAAAQADFGYSVAIEGNTIAVGATRANGTGDETGAVYVFVREGDAWSQEARLTASDGVKGDSFGNSVAIDGTTVVTGAPLDDHGGESSGSVYVFVQPEGGWADATEDLKLVAGDAEAKDEFGASVTIDGDRLAVGAPGDDLAAADSGSVYTFVRDGVGWVQEGLLDGIDLAKGDGLGRSTAIAGDVLASGAPLHDGDEADSGAVYVFDLAGD